MSRRALIASICLAAAALAWRPAPPPAPAAQILVSAAASLADALGEIGRAYERETKIRVALNVGGAPVDLFVSADEAQMDTVAAAGRLEAGSRVDLLGNQLVVVVPAGGPRLASSQDLTAASVRRIALADPAAVPAGVYAKRYLESLGLWHRLAPKVVPTLDVRAALAAVDAGNADAAFVYRTDAAIAHGAVVAFEVPLTEGPRIVYAAAIVEHAPHAAEARALLAYLEGAEARAVFDRFGFLVPDDVR